MAWFRRKWSVSDSITSSMLSCDDYEIPRFVFTPCEEEHIMYSQYMVSLRTIKTEVIDFM